ncbi:sensor histidine kinase [Lachnospiraceae bacterium ZAX-1]
MGNVMKRYKKGIVGKMSLATMLLILIPVAVICFLYVHLFLQSSEEKADKELNASLSSMQDSIDDVLSNAEAMLDELFYRQEFSYFMDGDNKLSEREINYYIGSVQKELINNRYLYANIFGTIGLYSDNRQIDETKYVWQRYLLDLEKKPYYAEITQHTKGSIYGMGRKSELATDTLINPKISAIKNRSYVLPIYRKVYAIGSEDVIGVVEVDVNIFRLIDEGSIRNVSPKAIKIVVDRNKEVMMNTSDEEEPFEQEILANIDMEQVSKIDSEQASQTRQVVIGGQKYRMLFQTDERIGFTKIALLSQEAVYENIYGMIVNVVLITLLCLGVMWIFTFAVMKNMLSRLVIVDNMMGKVKEGDFAVVIPDDGKEDEITSISQSFNVMVAHLDEVLEEKVGNEQIQKEAQIKALQAQINPHFLYNTLENMRMQCEMDGYYSISDSLSVLGELFRYSIKWGTKEVTFELEWKNLKNYLYIMNMRYEDTLFIELDCDDGLEDIIVPKMILQPLAENCFSHAFKRKMPPWELSVKAKMKEDYLIMEIADNGAGIEKGRLGHIRKCLIDKQEIHSENEKHASIGLFNVMKRVEMICKMGSHIEVDSKEDAGTKITIFIKMGEDHV